MNSPDSGWPPDDNSFTANQIDVICDEFESVWKSEGRPKIADYLSRMEEQSRSALLVELVRLDYAYRLDQGETPSAEEYVSLFPDYSDVLLTHVNEFSSVGKDFAEAPSRIGDIELLEKVGFGAFGTVWKSWDLELKRQVAVKLPSNKLEGKQQIELFLHEAQAAAKLHHPNIVPVYSSGQIEGRGYIVFKFIKGQTLRVLLNKQTPTFEQAAQICLTLAEGLEHAHQQGVIHRDLKPSNILIDEASQPHITDFGLAKLIDITASLAHSGTVLGTLAYMSPEQARGKSSEIEGHSDIYSLGAILYRILTKQIPFEGEPHEVLQQILNKEPIPPRKIEVSIPHNLETICLKAISKQKQDRYQTASEMAADLKCFLDKKPIQSRRVSVLGRLWRKVKQRPIVSVLATCIVFVSMPFGLQLISPEPVLAKLPLVTINTKPEGAKVAFIPLSKKTGQPLPEQIIHAEMTSPVMLPLEPGDYLVVAYFDQIRFQEVYRHVPESSKTWVPGFRKYNHLYYEKDRIDPNRIRLIEIEIPNKTVNSGMAWAGMALLKGNDRFPVGNLTDKHFHYRKIPDFWIDTTELNEKDYVYLSDTKPLHPIRVNNAPPMPAVLTFDMAVHLAEKAGKRLLSEYEFEYAATYRRAKEFPWDISLTDQEQASLKMFHPVGQPSVDQLSTTPPVFGLCSNVAEWTISQVPGSPKFFSYSHLTFQSINFDLPNFEVPNVVEVFELPHGIVRGGSRKVIEGESGITKELRDPRNRTFIPRTKSYSGLGVRFARSHKPRLKPKDFLQIVE